MRKRMITRLIWPMVKKVIMTIFKKEVDEELHKRMSYIKEDEEYKKDQQMILDFQEFKSQCEDYLIYGCDDHKQCLLRFELQAIVEDLSISLIKNFLQGKKQISNFEPFPLSYSNNGVQVCARQTIRRNVHIQDLCILAYPREFQRLNDINYTIQKEGFTYDPNNHNIFYFDGIGIGYVSCGQHSLTTGIILRQGMVDMKVYSMDEIFEAVEVNLLGDHYISSKEPHIVMGKIEDIRIAYIYEIARILYLIKQKTLL